METNEVFRLYSSCTSKKSEINLHTPDDKFENLSSKICCWKCPGCLASISTWEK